MTPASHRSAKLFTVEEASASLPLVRVITADWMYLARDLEERRQRVEALSSRREGLPGDLYGDELAHARQELERDSRRLRDFERELSSLGLVPRSVAEGRVDFPALVDGRLAYLCWKYDEAELAYWHGCEASCTQRRPLTVGSLSGPGGDEAEGLYPDSP